jgi:hypothetical protein
VPGVKEEAENANSSPDGRDWTYLFAGPFTGVSGYRDYVER